MMFPVRFVFIIALLLCATQISAAPFCQSDEGCSVGPGGVISNPTVRKDVINIARGGTSTCTSTAYGVWSVSILRRS